MLLDNRKISRELMAAFAAVISVAAVGDLAVFRNPNTIRQGARQDDPAPIATLGMVEQLKAAPNFVLRGDRKTLSTRAGGGGALRKPEAEPDSDS